jgi:hypothetical protein
MKLAKSSACGPSAGKDLQILTSSASASPLFGGAQLVVIS